MVMLRSSSVLKRTVYMSKDTDNTSKKHNSALYNDKKNHRINSWSKANIHKESYGERSKPSLGSWLKKFVLPHVLVAVASKYVRQFLS